MNVDFAFICDFAEATGKINALGIGFDTIYAQQLPARHSHFSLVVQLRASVAESGQKNIAVHLIDDDGKDIIPVVTGQMNLPRADGRVDSVGRFVMEFGNVEFKSYGSYSVRMAVEGLELVHVPFRVAPPPQQQKGK